MKTFAPLCARLTAIVTIFCLVATPDAVAIGFSCKFLLQNTFVENATDYAARGFDFLRRNVRPSRLFYRNLDRDAVARLVAKYQGDSRATTRFENDLKRRASGGGQFTAEEFFALDILRRPLEGRQLINGMLENDFVWVRRRFGIQDWISKDPARVRQTSKKYLKRFSFPRKVADKDFDYTTLSVVVAVAQADFADPDDLQVFAGPWEGFYQPLLDKWAKKNYPDLFSSTVYRSLYLTLARNLFENEATRTAWLMDFRDHLDHPEKLRTMLDELSPGAKQSYEKTGEAGLLNYLVNHEGTKRAAFWLGRLTMMAIGAVFAGKTIAKFFNKNTVNLYKGKGLSTEDPNAREALLCDFTEEDDNVGGSESGHATFDPTDPMLIGKVDFGAPHPIATAQVSKCDPGQVVMKEYVAHRQGKSADEFAQDPRRAQLYARWQDLILKQWRNKNSGCVEFYHQNLRSRSDCAAPQNKTKSPPASGDSPDDAPHAALDAAPDAALATDSNAPTN